MRKTNSKQRAYGITNVGKFHGCHIPESKIFLNQISYHRFSIVSFINEKLAQELILPLLC